MPTAFAQFIKSNYQKAPKNLTPPQKMKWLATKYKGKKITGGGARASRIAQGVAEAVAQAPIRAVQALSEGAAQLGSNAIDMAAQAVRGTKVRVCTVAGVDPRRYADAFNRYRLQRVDSQTTFYRMGDPVPESVLKRPFRLEVVFAPYTDNAPAENALVWFTEFEDLWVQLCKTAVKCRNPALGFGREVENHTIYV